MRLLLALAALFQASAAVATAAVSDARLSWIRTYDEALAEAKKTGKPIFLEFRCAP